MNVDFLLMNRSLNVISLLDEFIPCTIKKSYLILRFNVYKNTHTNKNVLFFILSEVITMDSYNICLLEFSCIFMSH